MLTICTVLVQWGETYDWRLSVPNMESRDHYFTRLKWRIELMLLTEKEKVLQLTHTCCSSIRNEAHQMNRNLCCQ